MVNKVVLIGVLWCLYGGVFAQEGRRLNPESGIGNFGRQDTLSAAQRKSTGIKNIKNENAKIEDYLIISYLNDTTHVDTTLTIQKEYKFNYLRRDNFGLMPFSNLGQTYNTLTQNLQSTALMPVFGARARHFNYMEIEDINYYRVPTPLTELFFKTAFEQGQLADSFFTVNTSPRFNFSIAYKGLRSLGNYQHLLTSTGNFRFTTNYSTKNNQYHFRAHIVMQDLLNQENGGLRDDMVENFESGIAEFLDRSLLEVNFENAESILKGKRFHVEHAYSIIRKKDSLSKNNMSIGHIMSFKDKFYEFSQTSAVTAYFGQASENSIKDKVTLENFYNQFYVSYSNDLLGDLQFNLNHNNYNYGYNSLYRDVKNGIDVTNRLKGDIVSAGGKYHKQFKGLELHGELGLNISGEFEGNFLNAHVGFKLNEEVFARASINHNSKVPNYNTLLYQSKYVHYNWENHFNNTESQQLAFQIKYKDFADITVDYTTLNDYVYFGEDQGTNSIKPFQSNASITYLRVKWVNELRAGKFALHNTVLYQNVQNDNEVFNVPQFITRNTLYFSSHVFKKAMYLQTGLTLNYFTKYYMNAYSPLLAEFYVQRDKEYGGFPRLDFFVNAKIRQTRIFLKAEHFNAPFTGYNYYAAPNTPYRDFIVRFGVVWNFFL